MSEAYSSAKLTTVIILFSANQPTLTLGSTAKFKSSLKSTDPQQFKTNNALLFTFIPLWCYYPLHSVNLLYLRQPYKCRYCLVDPCHLSFGVLVLLLLYGFMAHEIK